MRILLLCRDPKNVLRDPDSVAAALRDLGSGLELSGYDLRELAGAEERLPPTLVVIDAGDDLELARWCRGNLAGIPRLASLPTLLAVEVSRLGALDFAAGFDDFILLPIVPAELYARLRQLDWRTAAFGSDEVIKVGDLVIDIAAYEVTLRGRRLDFTHQEFELLRYLASNRGRVYSREQLLQKVWGYRPGSATRTVDIHIRRLRAKLGDRAGLIETVRNVGYKLRGPDEQ